MMDKALFKNLTAAVVLLSPLHAFSDVSSSFHSFLPKNDARIPVGALTVQGTASGVTELEYNSVLDQVEKAYAPVVAAKKATLSIDRAWSNDEVNAYAWRSGSTWMVQMLGGIARHPLMNADGFAAVTCHEVGHHLGGAPRYPQGLAADGQSDYFATLKCLRKVWENDDNSAIVAKMTVAPVVQSSCEKSFSDRASIAICIRSSYAGLSAASTLAKLSRLPAPTFETPDLSKVLYTNVRHPKAQCRLDTYFAGSICPTAWADELNDFDATAGNCAMEKGATVGYRPLCWYKPSML